MRTYGAEQDRIFTVCSNFEVTSCHNVCVTCCFMSRSGTSTFYRFLNTVVIRASMRIARKIQLTGSFTVYRQRVTCNGSQQKANIEVHKTWNIHLPHY